MLNVFQLKRMITKAELEEELDELQSELNTLAGRAFDVEMFKFKRNYILGTHLVDELSRTQVPEMIIKEVTWNRMYSEETIPQHWLYYLLTLVEVKQPKLFEDIMTKFKDVVDMNALYNREPGVNKRIDLSTEELYEILLFIHNQVLPTLAQRLEGNVKISKMLNELRAEDLRQSMRVVTLIETKQKQLAQV